MRLRSLGLKWYLERIEADQYFSFVRFGNGEFDGMFSTAERTGSGSQDLTVKGLSGDLYESIQFNSKNYLRALQSPGYLRRVGLWPRVEKEFRRLNFVTGDVFHRASGNGNLFPLIPYLQVADVGLIGPKHLEGIYGDLNVKWHVVVDDTDCYVHLEDYLAAIRSHPRVKIYSFSAGPAAKVMIRRMHRVYTKFSFLIDFGSLWDVYCGVPSRGYQRKMSEKVIKCNLGRV